MKRLLVLVLLVFVLVVASVAYAGMSNQEAWQLCKQADKLMEEKEVDEAIGVLKKVLAEKPDYRHALYRMACAYSLKKKKKKAIDYLENAIDAGYDGMHTIERDPRLKYIRGHRRCKAIIKRKDEIQLKGAKKRAKALEPQKDPGDLLEIDQELKIIWAVGRSKLIYEELKKEFKNIAGSLNKTLFEHKRDYYILALISHGHGGFYNHQRKELCVPHEGLHLIHEYVHSLHYADQDHRGQNHPAWISEGFATLFETSAMIKGELKPMPNFRLGTMKKILNTGSYVPWEEFFKMKGFGGLNKYAIARYMFYYFHEKGKLKDWYDTYCATYKKDRTSKLAVEKVFGKSLAQVEEDFKKWVPNAPGGFRPPKGTPHLGVNYKYLGDTLVGITISKVHPGGPADRAGMKPGDVINKFAGKKYTNVDAFRMALSRQEIGKKVRVVVFRGKKKLTLRVKMMAQE